MCSSLARADTQILDGIGILSFAWRGGPWEAPENTLAAFQNAITSGADFIECDLQKTADNVPVCFHDATVDAKTNGTGVLADMTLAELKLLDAGSWFGPEFAGEQIPTLEEALLLVNGQAVILLDPKYLQFGADAAAVHAATGLPANAIGVWTVNHHFVNNFDTLVPGSIIVIRKSLPSTTIENTIEWFQDPEGGGIASAVSLLWDVSADPQLLEELIHLFHTQGFPVLSQIIGNPSDWDAALAAGMDGLFIPNPAQLAAYFEGFECGNGVDDDLDTATDYPMDFECDWPRDASEEAVCSDGQDNDRDGFVDFPNDPGCSSPADTTETNPATPCDDGIDNDGDYYADLWDTGCNDLLDTIEGLPDPSPPPRGPGPVIPSPGTHCPAHGDDRSRPTPSGVTA